MEISKHKKGSDDYLIEMTDFVIGDLVYEKDHLFKAYNYYNGIRDKYLYQHLEDNFGIGNPTSILFTPLIRKHIDALVGEFLTTELRPKISCKDEGTLKSIYRDKLLEIAKKSTEYARKFLDNAIYDMLSGKKQLDLKLLDPVILQQLNHIKEDVDINFLSAYEIAGLNIVQYILLSRKMDFKNKLHLLLLDLLISGEAYYKVIPSSSGTNFKIEVEDPLNTWVDKDPKSKYLKNGYKSVVRKWMTKEEIIIKYGNVLTQKDIDDLDDLKSYDFDNHNFIMVSGLNSRCGGTTNRGILDGVGITPDYTTNYMNRKWDLIPVYEVEWIDWIKDGKSYYGNRYITTRIGSDIYILTGEDETLVRDSDAPNEATLALNGLFYTDGHGAPYSLMLATANLLDEYDLMLYYKNNIIALSGTKGANVDIAHLPEKLGSNFEERLMKYLAYRKTGLSLFDSSLEGEVVNTIFAGYNDMVEPGAIQSIQLAILMIEEIASSITGVFRERLGGILQRDAVANVEAGMLQSYIITKLYYLAMDTLVSEILTDCLNLARKVYKNGFTGEIVLGERREIFTLMPENYSQTDFDVHVINSTDVIKELELIKQLAQGLMQSNMVDPEVVLMVSTCKSTSEMLNKVKQSIQLKKMENNQLQQLTQQLLEAQKAQKELQAQLEKATTKLASLNEKKMNIEQADNDMKNQIEWQKIKMEDANKKRELDLIENRNKLEAAQIVANDGDLNNEILDRKY